MHHCKDCRCLELDKQHEPMKLWEGEPIIIHNWCSKGHVWRDPDEPVCQVPEIGNAQ